jgi:hypothetical protein
MAKAETNMVKLYRERISSQADMIEAELKDMIFGYDRQVMNPAQAAEQFGADHSLPVITNNEKIVSGDQILAYIKELRMLMNDWQAFQGDSCYVNDKGENC